MKRNIRSGGDVEASNSPPAFQSSSVNQTDSSLKTDEIAVENMTKTLNLYPETCVEILINM